MPGLAVDSQPAQILVHHMHIDHAVIDQFGKQASFGQCGIHPLFQLFVKALQGLLCTPAFGDILEQHRYLAFLSRLYAESSH